MAINPNIPLSLTPNLVGSTVNRGITDILAQRERKKQQDIVNERQNRLLQLKEDEASRLQTQRTENEVARSVSTSYRTELKPLYEQGDFQGVSDILNQKLQTVGPQSPEGVALNAALDLHSRDPKTAQSRFQQVVNQAIFDKLIPGEPKEEDILSKAKVDKFTPESIAIAERTGKRSDLRLREGQKKPPKQTFGQKAVDREFAKEFVPWVTGGFADVEKGLTQLKVVEKRLGGDENLTGPVLGRTPDIARALTHPESLDVRDNVEEIVQRNLRLILGPQFTEREGVRLIARAYNENLDEAVNKVRVGRLIKSIEDAAKAKQAAVEYYEENQTLAGFKGRGFSMEDINRQFTKELKNLDDIEGGKGSSEFQEGQTATNNEGEKIVFKDGKWQKQ